MRSGAFDSSHVLLSYLIVSLASHIATILISILLKTLKTLSLCLLRLYRTDPDCVDVTRWIQPLQGLLTDPDLGVVTSVMSLLTSFASHNTDVFESLVPSVVAVLTKLVTDNICSPEYQYYRIPCPWLQIKCLRFLQYYKEPDGMQWNILNSCLLRLLTRGDNDEESVNIQNTHYALVFEAIALVVSWGAASGGQGMLGLLLWLFTLYWWGLVSCGMVY